MRQIEARVLDLPDDTRAFDTEAGGAEHEFRHVFKAHAVHALLIKIVHVLAIGLAVGDDVEAEIDLVLRGPFDHLVRFGLVSVGFFIVSAAWTGRG